MHWRMTPERQGTITATCRRFQAQALPGREKGLSAYPEVFDACFGAFAFEPQDMSQLPDHLRRTARDTCVVTASRLPAEGLFWLRAVLFCLFVGAHQGSSLLQLARFF